MSETAKKRTACPICRRPSSAEFHPFCTKRCADIDLGRWLGGVYRVETEEPPEDPNAVRRDEE